MRAVNIEGQHYGASDKPDAVVAYPATAESANRQFPAWRLLLVGAAVDLPSMLCHGDFGTVTFVGGWRDLTVTVSRALTEWAAVDERRGCGVVLAEDESSPTSRLEAGRPKPVMGVHDQIALLVSGLPGGDPDRSRVRAHSGTATDNKSICSVCRPSPSRLPAMARSIASGSATPG